MYYLERVFVDTLVALKGDAPFIPRNKPRGFSGANFYKKSPASQVIKFLLKNEKAGHSGPSLMPPFFLNTKRQPLQKLSRRADLKFDFNFQFRRQKMLVKAQ